MSYLSIRNWHRYQHYRDRRPPWIKFYVELLDDAELHALPYVAQLLFDRLLLLAAKNDNAILKNSEWIAKQTGIEPELCAKSLDVLIEGRWLRETQTRRRASSPLAKRSKNARPEIETEEEIEKLSSKRSVTTTDDDKLFYDLTDIGLTPRQIGRALTFETAEVRRWLGATQRRAPNNPAAYVATFIETAEQMRETQTRKREENAPEKRAARWVRGAGKAIAKANLDDAYTIFEDFFRLLDDDTKIRLRAELATAAAPAPTYAEDELGLKRRSA